MEMSLLGESYLQPYVEKMALRILNIVNSDGGYPATREGDESCIWTSFSLPASVISAIGPRQEDKLTHRSTIKWLHENDVHEGLFPMVCGTKPSCDCTATAFEFLSRFHLGYGLDDNDYAYALKIGKSILNAQEGGWGFLFEERNSTAFSTYWVLRSLDVGKVAFPELKPLIETAFEKAGNWLLSTQNDNSWYDCLGNKNILYSAMALLSLKICNKIDQKEYDNFCDFIVQDKYNEIEYDDVIERHGGLTVVRFAFPWCILAISSSSYPKYKTVIDLSLAKLLNIIKEDKLYYKKTELNTWPSRDVLICLSEVSKSPYSMSLSDLLSSPYNAQRKKKQELERFKNAVFINNVSKKVHSKYRILHLSDLHFRYSPSSKPESLSPQNIFKDLKNMGKESIDTLVISGDIITNKIDESGKQRAEIEFNKAANFIKDLTSLLNIPHKNVIVVPGNHDVNWEEDASYIKDVNISDISYRNFYLSLFHEEPNEYLSMSYYDERSNISIMGLNSCLRCREKGTSWAGYVGEEQFYYTFNELKKKESSDNPFRIVVLHHHLVPVSYVEGIPEDKKHISLTLDSEGLIKKLLQNNFDCMLHGHQH